MKIRYSIFLFLLLLSASQNIFANQSLTTIEELVSRGAVSIQIEGKGGHQNKCIQVIIQNHLSDSVSGYVEAGRRLNSLNDNEQDILVVKSEKFKLGGHKKDTLLLTGFCCQSKKSSPAAGALFSIGTMAPAIWLFITNLINLNEFPSDAIQHSIWVLSDNHDIRSIPAYKAPAVDRLRHAVADILDIELPWYSFKYAGDSATLYSGTKTHFFAEVAFEIPQRAIITPQVATPAGEIIYTGDPQYFRAGENVISVEFPLDNWIVAPYDLHIMEDFHTTNQKLRFTLEDPE